MRKLGLHTSHGVILFKLIGFIGFLFRQRLRWIGGPHPTTLLPLRPEGHELHLREPFRPPAGVAIDVELREEAGLTGGWIDRKFQFAELGTNEGLVFDSVFNLQRGKKEGKDEGEQKRSTKKKKIQVL